MGFLANILKIILPTILNWIYEKVSFLVSKFVKNKKIEEEADKDTTNLESAKDSQEIKDSAKDLANHL